MCSPAPQPYPDRTTVSSAVCRLALRERGWIRELEAWLLDVGHASPTSFREGLGAVGRRLRDQVVALEDYSASRGVRAQSLGRLPALRREASPTAHGRRLRHLRFVHRRLRGEVGDALAQARERRDLPAVITLRGLARLHGDADRLLARLLEEREGAFRGLAA